jgi:four helix bundle protein
MSTQCPVLSAGWQKAIFVTEIYKVTDNFPKREVYSLTDQIRRAAVSVPSNIAEGQAHYNKREFLPSFAILQARWRSLRRNC